MWTNKYRSRLTQRDRSGRALILVAMLVQQHMKLLDGNVGLIHQHVIVRRTSRSLYSHVRAEVHIIFPRVGHIVLDQCAWHRIAVLIGCHARRRKEADVMSLLSNNDCHFGLSTKLVIITRSSQTKVHTLLAGARWPISSMRCLMSATS